MMKSKKDKSGKNTVNIREEAARDFTDFGTGAVRFRLGIFSC